MQADLHCAAFLFRPQMKKISSADEINFNCGRNLFQLCHIFCPSAARRLPGLKGRRGKLTLNIVKSCSRDRNKVKTILWLKVFCVPLHRFCERAHRKCAPSPAKPYAERDKRTNGTTKSGTSGRTAQARHAVCARRISGQRHPQREDGRHRRTPANFEAHAL